MIGVTAPSILNVADLDVADKELVLQVRGPSRQGQIVRLKSKKCTIGSGPRCTLRLRARGVRPLHCLVLRGDAGTVIRSLAPDTRLNGRVFTDAELVTGDRLGVGPLEFEVIEPDVSSQARLDQQQAKADDPQKNEPREEEWNRRRIELDDLAAKLGRSEKEFDERERSLSQRDADLNQRAEQIDRSRADLESERRAFEDQRRAWDADRAASESQASEESQQIEARQAEWTTRREALEQEIQRHQGEQAEAEARLGQRTSELDARQSELDTRQNELDARQSEQDARHGELDARQNELNAGQAALDAHHGELDTRQSELDAHHGELDARQNELNAGQAALDARQADLDARESAIDEARRQMEIEGRPVDGDTWSEPASETERPEREEDVRLDEASPGAPESSEEVLARMGMAPSFSDDEADEPPPCPPGSPRSGHAVPLNPPVKSEGDQDESIDDYMARLLHRVRETSGQPNQPTPPRSPQETAVDKVPPSAPVAEQDNLPQGTPPPAATPRETTAPAPRAAAPEKSVDIAAMRELANFSARAALNRHARRGLLGSVVGRLVVALVGLAAGTILTWIWWAYPTNTTVLCAAAMSFVVVLLWGVDYVLLRGYADLSQPGPGRRDDNAEEHAADSSQPEQEAEESL